MSQEPPAQQPWPHTNPPPNAPYPPYPQQYPGYPPYPQNQGPARNHAAPVILGVLGGCLALFIIAIVGGIAFLGVTFGSILHTLKNTKTVSASTSQTLSVTGAPTISMTQLNGSFTVLSGTSNQVVIEITKYATATDQTKAQALLEQGSYDVHQNGNTITITTSQPPETNPFSIWRLDVTLTVPPTSNLLLKGNAGQISVQDISGLMNLSTDAGTIHASHVVLFNNSTITTKVGDIILADQTSIMDSSQVTIQTDVGKIMSYVSLGQHDSLLLTSNVGDITLSMPKTTSAHIDATTGSAGTISVTGFNLPVSSNGVHADTAPNPTNTLTLKTSVGTLSITGS